MGFRFTSLEVLGESYLDSWIHGKRLVFLSLASLADSHCRTWARLLQSIIVSVLDIKSGRLVLCGPSERAYLLKEYLDRLHRFLPQVPPGVLPMQSVGGADARQRVVAECPWDTVFCGRLVANVLHSLLNSREARVIPHLAEGIINCFS
eukprot:Protomagalhaensia_sp_Gyna_25__2576@NODE_2465_length_1073_cov_2_067698_g2041_i0_p2_GENE_NODE_2465_length_1073_cov_2_067698_g2041_i0NODE_2465_length_1073_cov_2_067698_g2041_i0_p2_ORF_typecomplete_len149_score2_84Radical_SAM_C/PF16199_5/57Radical_SAM_C/PF16199_5/9_4_NODE_2465_length_1073_cov_2_067698_g2041_i0156602